MQVVATNAIGDGSALNSGTITMPPPVSPSAPPALTVSKVSSSAVTLLRAPWQPTGGANITAYVVFVNVLAAPAGVVVPPNYTATFNDVEVTEFRITALHGSSSFQFRLAAQNVVGYVCGSESSRGLARIVTRFCVLLRCVPCVLLRCVPQPGRVQCVDPCGYHGRPRSTNLASAAFTHSHQLLVRVRVVAGARRLGRFPGVGAVRAAVRRGHHLRGDHVHGGACER